MYNTELYHYGVKGMKWGVRRAKASNGTISRKQAMKEYREDNEKAKELGDAAAFYSEGLQFATKRTNKAKAKLDKAIDKNPEKALKYRDRYKAASNVKEFFEKGYAITHDRAKAHCDELVKKYGDTAVKKLRYADRNGRSLVTQRREDNIMTLSMTLGSGFATTALAASGHLPIAFFVTQETSRSSARLRESLMYTNERNKQRRK